MSKRPIAKIRVIAVCAALVVGGAAYAVTSPSPASSGPAVAPPSKPFNPAEPHPQVGPDGKLALNPDGTVKMAPPLGAPPQIPPPTIPRHP